MYSKIQKAIEILNAAGVIIYPTDTAYGIGCRIDRTEAVDRLFRIRNRPTTQATPILVSSVNMALDYFENANSTIVELMGKYWPGALTIIGKCKSDIIYAKVRGGIDTIGIRMPNHPLPLKIIENLNVPILGPSANFHDSPTPYKTQDLDPNLIRKVDLLITGKMKYNIASTVVDCTQNKIKIIRQGAINIRL